MQLTREYFENHPQWSTSWEKVDEDTSIWEAKLLKEYPYKGNINLMASNTMYEWRFNVHGYLNGSGESGFYGDIYVCTVEELEGFFKICHFDDYRYTL